MLSTIGAVAWPLLSHRVARLTFRVLARVYALTGWHAVPRLTGSAVMVAVAGFWVAGFSVAWTLVYLGGDPAITVEDSARAAGVVDIWAHVGHLLSTLGGAITQPASGAWNVIGVLVGINGMVALTLAVSFTLSTTNTASQSRALARLVHLDADAPGGVDPARHEARLAEVVSGMNAAPFAAYYAHPDREVRFVTALKTLLDAAQPRDSRGFARLLAICADLPDLDLRHLGSPEAREAAIRAWCDDRSLPHGAAADGEGARVG